MNLNELCLLEFLKNSEGLTQLVVLLKNDFPQDILLTAVQYENYVI